MDRLSLHVNSLLSLRTLTSVMTCALAVVVSLSASGADSARDSVTPQVVVESASRITEADYTTLAIDAELTTHSTTGSIRCLVFFRYKQPGKFSFVLADSHDSVPVLVLTKEATICYDRLHDKLWSMATGEFAFRFGLRNDKLYWNCYWGGEETNRTPWIVLDFPSIMKAFAVDQKLQPTEHKDEWTFSGKTRRGNSGEVRFKQRATIPYRQVKLRAGDLWFDFNSIVADVEITDSVFDWRKESLLDAGETMEKADKNPNTIRDAVSLLGLAEQSRNNAPRNVKLTHTARVLMESVQKMVRPVSSPLSPKVPEDKSIRDGSPSGSTNQVPLR